MKQSKISKNTIDSYLLNVIEESVKAALHKKAIQEKENQTAVAQSLKNEAEEVPSGDEEKEKLKKGDVTVDDIVEKLNSIRSGKSLKDEKIAESLGKYFDDLDEAEKVALLAFLKGISQIVTGEIEGPEAVDPGSKEAGIEMKKTGGPEKVSIKPNVIKAPDIETEKTPSAEDTSGPVPITPKK